MAWMSVQENIVHNKKEETFIFFFSLYTSGRIGEILHYLTKILYYLEPNGNQISY